MLEADMEEVNVAPRRCARKIMYRFSPSSYTLAHSLPPQSMVTFVKQALSGL